VDNQFGLRKSIVLSLIHWEHLIRLASEYKRRGVNVDKGASIVMADQSSVTNDRPSYGGCSLCVYCDQICERCPLPDTTAGRCVGRNSEEIANSVYYRATKATSWDEFITCGKIIADALMGLCENYDATYDKDTCNETYQK